MVLVYLLYAALAGSAAYMGQMMSPRMLAYKLRVAGIPRLSRSPKGGYNLALSAGVELMNENLVHLDVHAISFDFYSSAGNNGSEIRHLGTVKSPTSSSSTTAATPSTLFTNSSSAFWSVSGQSMFRTRSRMNLSLKVVPLLKSLWRLMGNMLRYGFVEIPTTGVAHIKAAAASNYTAMPFTFSIVCDNRVDLTWAGFDITGKTCEMKNMVPGWNDLDEMAASVRRQQLGQS